MSRRSISGGSDGSWDDVNVVAAPASEHGSFDPGVDDATTVLPDDATEMSGDDEPELKRAAKRSSRVRFRNVADSIDRMDHTDDGGDATRATNQVHVYRQLEVLASDGTPVARIPMGGFVSGGVKTRGRRDYWFPYILMGMKMDPLKKITGKYPTIGTGPVLRSIEMLLSSPLPRMQKRGKKLLRFLASPDWDVKDADKPNELLDQMGKRLRGNGALPARMADGMMLKRRLAKLKSTNMTSTTSYAAAAEDTLLDMIYASGSTGVRAMYNYPLDMDMQEVSALDAKAWMRKPNFSYMIDANDQLADGGMYEHKLKCPPFVWPYFHMLAYPTRSKCDLATKLNAVINAYFSEAPETGINNADIANVDRGRIANLATMMKPVGECLICICSSSELTRIFTAMIDHWRRENMAVNTQVVTTDLTQQQLQDAHMEATRIEQLVPVIFFGGDEFNVPYKVVFNHVTGIQIMPLESRETETARFTEGTLEQMQMLSKARYSRAIDNEMHSGVSNVKLVNFYAYTILKGLTERSDVFSAPIGSFVKMCTKRKKEFAPTNMQTFTDKISHGAAFTRINQLTDLGTDCVDTEFADNLAELAMRELSRNAYGVESIGRMSSGRFVGDWSDPGGDGGGGDGGGGGSGDGGGGGGGGDGSGGVGGIAGDPSQTFTRVQLSKILEDVFKDDSLKAIVKREFADAPMTTESLQNTLHQVQQHFVDEIQLIRDRLDRCTQELKRCQDEKAAAEKLHEAAVAVSDIADMLAQSPPPAWREGENKDPLQRAVGTLDIDAFSDAHRKMVLIFSDLADEHALTTMDTAFTAVVRAHRQSNNTQQGYIDVIGALSEYMKAVKQVTDAQSFDIPVDWDFIQRKMRSADVFIIMVQNINDQVVKLLQTLVASHAPDPISQERELGVFRGLVPANEALKDATAPVAVTTDRFIVAMERSYGLMGIIRDRLAHIRDNYRPVAGDAAGNVDAQREIERLTLQVQRIETQAQRDITEYANLFRAMHTSTRRVFDGALASMTRMAAQAGVVPGSQQEADLRNAIEAYGNINVNVANYQDFPRVQAEIGRVDQVANALDAYTTLVLGNIPSANDVTALRAQITTLQEAVSVREATIAAAGAPGVNAARDAELRDVRTQLDVANAHAATLDRAVAEARANRDGVQALLDTANRQLVAERDHARARGTEHTNELGALRKQVHELTVQLRESNENLQRATEEATALRTQTEKLTLASERAREQLATVRAERATATGEITRMRAHADGLRAEIARLQGLLSAAQGDALDVCTRQFNQQLADLRAQVEKTKDECQRRIDELTDQLKQQTDNVERLNAQIAELQQRERDANERETNAEERLTQEYERVTQAEQQAYEANERARLASDNIHRFLADAYAAVQRALSTMQAAPTGEERNVAEVAFLNAQAMYHDAHQRAQEAGNLSGFEMNLAELELEGGGIPTPSATNEVQRMETDTDTAVPQVVQSQPLQFAATSPDQQMEEGQANLHDAATYQPTHPPTQGLNLQPTQPDNDPAVLVARDMIQQADQARALPQRLQLEPPVVAGQDQQQESTQSENQIVPSQAPHQMHTAVPLFNYGQYIDLSARQPGTPLPQEVAQNIVRQSQSEFVVPRKENLRDNLANTRTHHVDTRDKMAMRPKTLETGLTEKQSRGERANTTLAIRNQQRRAQHEAFRYGTQGAEDKVMLDAVPHSQRLNDSDANYVLFDVTMAMHNLGNVQHKGTGKVDAMLEERHGEHALSIIKRVARNMITGSRDAALFGDLYDVLITPHENKPAAVDAFMKRLASFVEPSKFVFVVAPFLISCGIMAKYITHSVNATALNRVQQQAASLLANDFKRFKDIVEQPFAEIVARFQREVYQFSNQMTDASSASWLLMLTSHPLRLMQIAIVSKNANSDDVRLSKMKALQDERKPFEGYYTIYLLEGMFDALAKNTKKQDGKAFNADNSIDVCVHAHDAAEHVLENALTTAQFTELHVTSQTERVFAGLIVDNAKQSLDNFRQYARSMLGVGGQEFTFNDTWYAEHFAKHYAAFNIARFKWVNTRDEDALCLINMYSMTCFVVAHYSHQSANVFRDMFHALMLVISGKRMSVAETVESLAVLLMFADFTGARVQHLALSGASFVLLLPSLVAAMRIEMVRAGIIQLDTYCDRLDEKLEVMFYSQDDMKAHMTATKQFIHRVRQDMEFQLSGRTNEEALASMNLQEPLPMDESGEADSPLLTYARYGEKTHITVNRMVSGKSILDDADKTLSVEHYNTKSRETKRKVELPKYYDLIQSVTLVNSQSRSKVFDLTLSGFLDSMVEQGMKSVRMMRTYVPRHLLDSNVHVFISLVVIAGSIVAPRQDSTAVVVDSIASIFKPKEEDSSKLRAELGVVVLVLNNILFQPVSEPMYSRMLIARTVARIMIDYVLTGSTMPELPKTRHDKENAYWSREIPKHAPLRINDPDKPLRRSVGVKKSTWNIDLFDTLGRVHEYDGFLIVLVHSLFKPHTRFLELFEDIRKFASREMIDAKEDMTNSASQHTARGVLAHTAGCMYALYVIKYGSPLTRELYCPFAKLQNGQRELSHHAPAAFYELCTTLKFMSSRHSILDLVYRLSNPLFDPSIFQEVNDHGYSFTFKQSKQMLFRLNACNQLFAWSMASLSALTQDYELHDREESTDIYMKCLKNRVVAAAHFQMHRYITTRTNFGHMYPLKTGIVVPKRTGIAIERGYLSRDEICSSIAKLVGFIDDVQRRFSNHCSQMITFDTTKQNLSKLREVKDAIAGLDPHDSLNGLRVRMMSEGLYAMRENVNKLRHYRGIANHTPNTKRVATYANIDSVNFDKIAVRCVHAVVSRAEHTGGYHAHNEIMESSLWRTSRAKMGASVVFTPGEIPDHRIIDMRVNGGNAYETSWVPASVSTFLLHSVSLSPKKLGAIPPMYMPFEHLSAVDIYTCALKGVQDLQMEPTDSLVEGVYLGALRTRVSSVVANVMRLSKGGGMQGTGDVDVLDELTKLSRVASLSMFQHLGDAFDGEITQENRRASVVPNALMDNTETVTFQYLGRNMYNEEDTPSGETTVEDLLVNDGESMKFSMSELHHTIALYSQLRYSCGFHGQFTKGLLNTGLRPAADEHIFDVHVDAARGSDLSKLLKDNFEKLGDYKLLHVTNTATPKTQAASGKHQEQESVDTRGSRASSGGAARPVSSTPIPTSAGRAKSTPTQQGKSVAQAPKKDDKTPRNVAGVQKPPKQLPKRFPTDQDEVVSLSSEDDQELARGARRKQTLEEYKQKWDAFCYQAHRAIQDARLGEDDLLTFPDEWERTVRGVFKLVKDISADYETPVELSTRKLIDAQAMVTLLQQGQCLLNGVIDTYMQLLQNKHGDCLVLTTTSYNAYVFGSRNANSFKSTYKLSPCNARLVVVPHHVNGIHWIVSIVDILNGTITTIDPIAHIENHYTHESYLHLSTAFKELCKKDFVPVPHEIKTQMDGSSCGVHVMDIARLSLEGKDIMAHLCPNGGDSPCFTREQIMIRRYRLAMEILEYCRP